MQRMPTDRHFSWRDCAKNNDRGWHTRRTFSATRQLAQVTGDRESACLRYVAVLGKRISAVCPRA